MVGLPFLPAAWSPVMAQAVLADIIVRGGEVLLGEGALTGGRQADQDDEFHAPRSVSRLRRRRVGEQARPGPLCSPRAPCSLLSPSFTVQVARQCRQWARRQQ